MKKAKNNGRKDFIKKSIALSLLPIVKPGNLSFPNLNTSAEGPLVISTWKHAMAANDEAMEILKKGKSSLDAAEAGVRVSESDPEVSSVGYGGLPDRDGNVTLDACIMDGEGNCGSVGFLKHIKNPISVARKVMEDTPHVMICGDGALEFALEKGFKKEDLLTDKAREAWNKWKNTVDGIPVFRNLLLCQCYFQHHHLMNIKIGHMICTEWIPDRHIGRAWRD